MGGESPTPHLNFCAIQVTCRLPASGNLRFEQMSFVGKRIIYPMTLIMGAVRRIFSTNTYLHYKLDPSLPSNFFLNVITTAEWKSSCFTHSQKYPNSPVEVHLIHLNKGLLLSLHFMAWYIQVHQSEGVPMILRLSPLQYKPLGNMAVFSMANVLVKFFFASPSETSLIKLQRSLIKWKQRRRGYCTSRAVKHDKRKVENP